ncbi:MAG: hypothetical protein ACR2RV_22945 [Verrucomicrobiales bacterium]
MFRTIVLGILLVGSACTKENRSATVDREPIDEARDFLVSWIQDIGPEEFIDRAEGHDSYLPIDNWEIGIDGKRNEGDGSFEFGVYYPYSDAESGRTLMDLLGAIVKEEGGEWKVIGLLH